MRRLLFFLLALLIAVWLGVRITADPGYMLIAYKHWTIEMPLWLSVIGLLLAFAVLYFLLRTIQFIRFLPRRWRQWRIQRYCTKGQMLTQQGLIALAQGYSREADKKLLKATRYVKTPWLEYLALALSAQQQGNLAQLNILLEKAYAAKPDAEVAVGIVQAKFQLAQNKYEQALALLQRLRTLAPKQFYILKLLADIYVHLNEWNKLIDLLPLLRRHEAMPKSELAHLEIQVYQNFLTTLTDNKDLAVLQNQWQRIPKYIREEPALILDYCKLLVQAGAPDYAEELIRKTVRKNYLPSLVHYYGLIKSRARQLATAESWLPAHPKDPVLLLTLGRLAQRDQLWGKARSYYDAGLSFSPTAEAYYALAQFLEQQNDSAKALMNYRKGLESVVNFT
jgi:HemY protein